MGCVFSATPRAAPEKSDSVSGMDTNENNTPGRASYRAEDRRELIAEFESSGSTQERETLLSKTDHRSDLFWTVVVRRNAQRPILNVQCALKIEH